MAVVAILFAGVLTLQLPQVQTFLTRKVTDALSSKLDGDIVFYNVYQPEIPLTGDNTPVALYAGLLVSSLMAMAAVLVLFRKKETV